MALSRCRATPDSAIPSAVLFSVHLSTELYASTTSSYSSTTRLLAPTITHERFKRWTNFMSASQFCIRACIDGPNAPHTCNHVRLLFLFYTLLHVLTRVCPFARSTTPWVASGTCPATTAQVSHPAKATPISPWVSTAQQPSTKATQLHQPLTLPQRLPIVKLSEPSLLTSQSPLQPRACSPAPSARVSLQPSR